MKTETTLNKNGSMTYKRSPADVQKQIEHECIQESLIEHNITDIAEISLILHGQGEYKGIVTTTELIQEQLKGIFKQQASIGNWIKATLFVFVLIFSAGVATYIKVEKIPDTYVSKEYSDETYIKKEYMLQYLDEFKEQTKTIKDIGVANQSDILELKANDKAHDDKLDYFMKATRGATKANPIHEPK